MWPRAYIVGDEGETVLPVLCKNKGSMRSRSSEKLPPGGCLVFGPTLQTFRKGHGWKLSEASFAEGVPAGLPAP